MSESIVKMRSSTTIVPRTQNIKTRLESVVASRAFIPLCLTLLLLGAAILRFAGLNWDENLHLHPDERFLTMVATNIQWPEDMTLGQYFDTATNPLSPYNHDFGLYVYGTFPLFLVKWVAIWLGQTDYNQIHLVGRALSALFDLGAIFFLFLVGRRLYGNRVALLGTALLSLTVLQIQHAHFFTVDTFANFFVVATVYFATRASQSGRWSDFILMGTTLGMGMASKISVFNLGLVAVLAGGLCFYRLRQEGTAVSRALEQVAVRLVLAGVLSILVFRVLQPIAFEGPSFFNFTLNETWLANMREVRDLVSGDRDFPPGHQWTNRTPLWFPWKNMVVWGMGLPLGLAAWGGFALAGYELFRRKKLIHLLPVIYVGLVFLYQGTQWVKSLRYFMPIYPFLALLAAYLLIWLWDWAAAPERTGQGSNLWSSRVATWLSPRRVSIGLVVVVLGGTLLYALAFTSIYRRPHTRVQASNWIYEHIPGGATLATEHWDDGLPQNLNGLSNSEYQYVTLTNYDEDTPEKLDQLVERLTQADYVIWSSNRLYDAIPRLPLRYPMTTRYYELLSAEALGFQKVAEFTAYPQLFGLELPDQSAEEAFTVYDHPKVTIFQKTADFTPSQVKRVLGEGIDWDGIIKLWPRQATKAPTGLMFSETDRQIYEAAGTWSLLFDPADWANRFPIMAWFLALTAIGLVAWPITFVTFGNLADRGYILSKAVGLLLVSWVVWLLASSRILPFDLAAVGVGIILVTLISALAGWTQREGIIDFWRTRWRFILTVEVLFWGLFFFLVWVRWNNPDLWHADRGGEKPMDFAYLNAVVRSVYFPPYDPWLAGGFINYYYFGFVLVAVLIKLTGIVPAVAYNLAVPTFFAMTAMGGFTVAHNLIAGWPKSLDKTASLPAEDTSVSSDKSKTRRSFSFAATTKAIGYPILAGFLAILFVAVMGNLSQARLLGQEAQSLSQVQFETTIPGLLPVTRMLDGIGELVREGRDLSARPEKWFWDATRVIPHPDTEASPITEFPFFTFLFADLHAHMMALPFTLLVLALAANILQTKSRGQLDIPPAVNTKHDKGIGDSAELDLATSSEASTPQAQVKSQRSPLGGYAHTVVVKTATYLQTLNWSELFAMTLLALTLGALWPLNTWDFPTYVVLTGATLVIREYGRWQKFTLGTVWAVTWQWGLIIGLGFVFFAPFHRHYATAYTGFELWQGSRTSLEAYLTIHGFFLFIIITYLLLELRYGSGHNGVVRLLRLVLRHRSRLGRLKHLCRLLVQPSQAYELVLQSLGFGLIAILGMMGLGWGVFALIMALIILITLLLFSSQATSRRQFILALIGLGVGLTLAVELIVLKGDISRMNTVFKFYLQIWVIWAVAAAACIPLIAAWLQPHAKMKRLWWPAFILLFMAGLLYPLLATGSRINSSFAETQALKTLDGTAYMAQARYHDQGQEIVLDWDRQAIEWLQTNLYGSPVIVEANTPIYRWGSRVAINTGLPTVIGWDWHQKQQHAILPADIIERRLRDVQTIYTDPDPQKAYDLLSRYNVQYIYVGPLEHLYYGSAGLDKFEVIQSGYWNLVYENAEVKILQTAASPPAAAELATAPVNADVISTPDASALNASAVPNFEASDGWLFTNMQFTASPDENNLVIRGNLINLTDSSQELILVTGIFYDSQGQVIADLDNTNVYWPVEIVPPGEQLPFEMIVEGIQSASKFNLRVEAEPSSHIPGQDFEFLDLNQRSDDNGYCLAGQLQMLDRRLQNYLIIGLTVYDDQDKVISFAVDDDYFEEELEAVGDDQTLDFELCADLPNQNVARYELWALGK